MPIKPILFNLEMVRAILDGRKTVTRRAVKPKYSNTDLVMFTNKYGTRLVEQQNDVPPPEEITAPDGQKVTRHHLVAMREIPTPYRPGDILWVRETWWKNYWHEYGTYFYRADGEEIDIPLITGGTRKHGKADGLKWHPSIHMPKEAARLFLRVTGVRVERLQDITTEQASAEGSWLTKYACPFSLIAEKYPEAHSKGIAAFANLWDSTIKPADRDRYGWNANPWVWVIEFERCERPNGWPG